MSAHQSIPRPTPLVPWRGPRGRGLGGDQTSKWGSQKQPTPATTSNAQSAIEPYPRQGQRGDKATCSVGQPQTGRQPRCQRRVARLRPQGTVWTESRPRPRATPFRVLLPWPPGGGLGAGGQGVIRRATGGSHKQPTPATTSPFANGDGTVPLPRGSVETRPYLPYSAATLGRQPRCQRHVARLWAPIQCGRKAARAPRHSASYSPGPLEGA